MDNKKETIIKIMDVLGIGEILGKIIDDKSLYTREMNQLRIEQEKVIKKEIIDSKTYTPEQRLQLCTLATNNKKFVRQMEVLNIAIENMNEESCADNLEIDWLLDLFDKSSLIGDRGMQAVYGKLVAYASTDRNICSKTLLNALFLMGTEQITAFQNLGRFCISEFGYGNCTDKIYSYPIVYFRKNASSYEAMGITRLKLNKLASLGLIEVNYDREFVFSKKNVQLIYNNKFINIRSEEPIKIGNVIFTYDGFLLYQMIEKNYNNRILDYNIERNFIFHVSM